MSNVLDYLVIFVYFAAMIAAGYWGMMRATSAEDYLVAGRRLGPFMYVGTLSAVVLGGASTIGSVSLGYQYGISGMWLVFMIGLGIIALGLLLSTRLSRLGVFTVAEMLELRYGATSRLIGAIIVSTYALMIAVTSTIAIGAVFDVILGLRPTAAILLAGGIVVLYSVIGGMWSITLTDVMQFCVMTVGIFLILLPLALSGAGGLSVMRKELPSSFFDLTSIGGGTIFTYFLLFFLGLMIGQDIWQRVFTARSASVARWGGVAAGIYCLLFALAGALIGTAARIVVPDLAVPDNAFAEVAREVVPAGLLGLVLAAALAAVMSTSSAGLLAASTLLANDVYARFVANRTHAGVGLDRLFTLVVGIVVLVLSVFVSDVIGALTVAYDLLVGAIFVPVVGALFWREATSAGALASMLAGGLTVIVLLLFQGLLANSPIYVGLIVSLIAFVVVSLLTPRTSRQTMSAWERRVRRRVY